MGNDYSDSLYHYGVLGMRWGKRRYQNKDGSLTSAGLKRKEQDLAGMKKSKRKDYEPNANKWVKEDLSRSKNLASSSSNLVNQLKTSNDKSIKNKPRKQMDLSNMTDKEMRDQINRKLLEKQYNDMFNPQTASKGREYTGKILESAGTALTITGSALAVALSIKELKG